MSSRRNEKPTTCGLTITIWPLRERVKQRWRCFEQLVARFALAICAEAFAGTLHAVAFAHWSPHGCGRWRCHINSPQMESKLSAYATLSVPHNSESIGERMTTAAARTFTRFAFRSWSVGGMWRKQIVQNFLEKFNKQSSAFTGDVRGENTLILSAGFFWETAGPEDQRVLPARENCRNSGLCTCWGPTARADRLSDSECWQSPLAVDRSQRLELPVSNRRSHWCWQLAADPVFR